MNKNKYENKQNNKPVIDGSANAAISNRGAVNPEKILLLFFFVKNKTNSI